MIGTGRRSLSASSAAALGSRDPGADLFADSTFSNPTSIDQIRGYSFSVVGVTRGDIRTKASHRFAQHYLQSLDLVGDSGGVKDWTLGVIAFVYGPPATPRNVQASAADGAVDVSWTPMRGASDYDVFWDDAQIDDPPIASVNPVGYLGVQNVPADSAEPCGVTVRITKGITNGTTYYFRLRANHARGDFYSDLSTEASARPSTQLPSRATGKNFDPLSRGTVTPGVPGARSGACSVDALAPQPTEILACPPDGLGLGFGGRWCRRVRVRAGDHRRRGGRDGV